MNTTGLAKAIYRLSLFRASASSSAMCENTKRKRSTQLQGFGPLYFGKLNGFGGGKFDCTRNQNHWIGRKHTRLATAKI